MRKYIVFLLLLFLTVQTALGAFTYGTDYYNVNKSHVGGDPAIDPLPLYMAERDALLDATAGTATASKALILNSSSQLNTLKLSSNLKILEGGSTPTKYTMFTGGDQTVDVNYVLPTGYPAVNGYVLSGTTGGVLSWVANAGTFTGGSITSDITLSDDVDILPTTTITDTWAIKVYDTDAPGYLDVLRWTNATTPTIVFGNATSSLAIASTGLNVTTAGVVTGVSTLETSSDVTVGGDLAVTGSFTPTTLYQSAIASAASGNVALTVNASGNGTIGIGLTSTGAITLGRATTASSTLTVTGATTLNGAVTLGDAAGDDITVTGDVVSNIRLDDDTTDSPSIQFLDAGENDWIILKANGATGNLTCTSDAATSDFQIVTGNLKVGGGSESLTLNGEDVYVTGTFEVDGAAQLDGLLTCTGGIASTGAAVNVNVSSNYATNINTGSSSGAVTIGGGSCTVAIASSGMDVSTTGAVSGVTTLSMSDDLTLADGKAVQGDTTTAHTWILKVYDVDNTTYRSGLTMTNGDVAGVSIGGGTCTVAIDSTDWDIDATGIMTGIGAITADGLITGQLGLTITGAITSLNASSNFATNINTGTSSGAVTIGGGSCTVEIASTAVDIGTTGAVSGITTLGISSTLTLQNSETIKNDTQGEIEFAADGGEDFSFNLLTSNTVGLTTDSGTDTWAWGDVDALTGVGSIAFDAAASTITLTASGNDQDMTIQQNGAFDSSLILYSTGTGSDSIYVHANGGVGESVKIHSDLGTSADSIYLLSDVGGITLTSSAGLVAIDALGASAGDMTLTVGDEFILDVTGGVAVDSAEEASDAIGLTASGTAGGITLNAGTGRINFSDDDINNVGDVYCDDIVDEADHDIMYVVKTVIKTIDVNGADSTDDFHFDSNDADAVEQIIDCGAIIPAYAEIQSFQLRCFEAVSGANDMTVDIGTSSGGDEIFTATTCDALNEILATSAGSSPELAATNAARHIYVNATPGANWDTLDVGRWAILVTYVDYGAAYTQKNP
jgi:hypothetical protein